MTNAHQKLMKTNRKQCANFVKAEKITIIKLWHATMFLFFLVKEGETVNRVNDDITPKKHPL